MRPRLTSTKVMQRPKCGESSWSKTYKLICEARWRKCHGLGLHGCLWSELTNLYWWCNSWWWQQDEFRTLHKHSVCLLTEKCIQINWEKLHHAAWQWPKAHCQHNKGSSLDWPGQSPNLNPIQNEFHLLKRRLLQSFPPSNNNWKRLQ